MRSKFAIAGHPIHPMLVALPIGLYIWALVSDVVYLARDRDALWYDISFWTSIAAIATALLAALPGFGDYFTMAVRSDARGTATTHMILNLTSTSLFIIAVLLMRDRGALDGSRWTIVLLLQLLAVGLLSVSGWLGGEMVFKHHLAMVPDDEASAAVEQTRHAARPEL